MKLSNSQYDAIMRMYDAKQNKSRIEHSRRLENVYSSIPAYKELCDQATSIAAESARAAITGKSNLPELKARLAKISQEKTELLVSNGFPSDYLEPGYECSLCKDTGMADGKRCKCFIQASIDLLYDQSNINKLMGLENFETFDYDCYSDNYIDSVSGLSARANIKNVVNHTKEFVSAFPAGENLLFFGNTGVGKSFLTHCIAKELLDKGYSVLYLTAIDLFDILGKYVFDREADYADATTQIYECDLLIIDDLGTETINSFTASRLFHCMESRSLKRLSTIISTNLDLAGLMNAYSERIFSRIAKDYNIYKIYGEDIRLNKRTGGNHNA